MEKYLAYLVILGVTLAAVGWLWLVVRAFRVRTAWGVAILLVPPLALVFLAGNTRRAAGPLVVLALADIVTAAPYGVNWYAQRYIDLGPREKLVEGELHITLTGWDKDDYSVLTARPDVVVLQMANADVTDATLEHLRGLQKLRELDLNDTQVTDQGLAVLAALPELQIIRLRKTKITDEGFRTHLLAKESLQELDVRETHLASKTMRAWKEVRKDTRKFLR